jgi:hypothetical protein
MTPKHQTADSLVRLAHAFGNRRDVRVEWLEFGGTSPMWSVWVRAHHVSQYRSGDEDQGWRRLGYAATLDAAVADAFHTIEIAKAQTVLNGDFDAHY